MLIEASSPLSHHQKMEIAVATEKDGSAVGGNPNCRMLLRRLDNWDQTFYALIFLGYVESLMV